MSATRFRYLAAAVAAVVLLPACSASPNAGVSATVLPQTHRTIANTSSTCPAYFAEHGLVIDGDFRQATDPGDTLVPETHGAAFAPDWVVQRGAIDFAGSKYWNIGGLCSVNLDGHPAGTIATKPFPTTNGAQYTVTFLISGYGCEGGGFRCSDIKYMAVRVGKQHQVFVWEATGTYDVQHGHYLEATWYFTAEKPQSVVELRSLDKNSSRRGCVVAALSVVPD